MFRSGAILSGAMFAVSAMLLSPAAMADNAKDAQQLVNDSAKTVSQVKQDPHFLALMKKAKGAFIVPAEGKGAFIVGGGGGQGVLVQHKSGGRWSDPAFLSIGSISIGAQAGGEGGPIVMLLMTDKAVQDFTQSNNFSINGNAGLTIVTYSAKGQAPVGKGDIIVWTNQKGAFVGANVSGSDITSNTDEDHAYYGPKATTETIIAGNQHNSHAAKLVDELPA